MLFETTTLAKIAYFFLTYSHIACLARKASVKTLRSSTTAKFSRHCVLCGETEVGIESTVTCLQPDAETLLHDGLKAT